MAFFESDKTILILLFSLLALIILLVFVYKKLNKETNGKYTIQQMVYKTGGIRDQVRVAAVALRTHFGIQLGPRNDTDEYGEEMHEVHDEEERVEDGDSCIVKDPEERDEEDEEEQEEEVDQNGMRNEKTDKTSDDSSGSENEEPKEQDHPGEKGEEKEEKVGEQKCQVEEIGGAGLLIDLKQFSGSATWSSEEGGERHVTAL